MRNEENKCIDGEEHPSYNMRNVKIFNESPTISHLESFP